MKDTQTRPPRVTFERLLEELRRRSFGVLSTVTQEGRSHSVGVVYGISSQKKTFEIYVMTRTHLKKARNIAANPNVSFVVPLTRRLIGFIPPPCVQFQGKATIVEYGDRIGIAVFKSFFVGRQILRKYEDLSRQGETRTCFLRIIPDPVVFTYMLGYSIWEVRRRMQTGTERVEILPER